MAIELVTNGGFESPTASGLTCFANTFSSGWTSFGPGGNFGSCFVSSGASAAGLTWPVSQTGAQLMLVNNQEFAGAKIAQNVAVSAGTPYQLTFSMSGVAGDATVPNLSVALAGVGSQTFSSTASTVWSNKAWTFTPANSGTFVLSFTADSGYVNLDSVSLQPVSAVPELSKSALFVAGAAVLLGVALRRRGSLVSV